MLYSLVARHSTSCSAKAGGIEVTEVGNVPRNGRDGRNVLAARLKILDKITISPRAVLQKTSNSSFVREAFRNMQEVFAQV